jgi:hypothetical protein
MLKLTGAIIPGPEANRLETFVLLCRQGAVPRFLLGPVPVGPGLFFQPTGENSATVGPRVFLGGFSAFADNFVRTRCPFRYDTLIEPR